MSFFHFLNNLIFSLEISYTITEIIISLYNKYLEKFEISIVIQNKSFLIFSMRKNRLNNLFTSEKRESSSCLNYTRSNIKRILIEQRMKII